MAPGDDDDDLLVSEVERRREPRGLVPGLELSFDGKTYPIGEASRRGFFLELKDPDSVALGKTHDATVSFKTGKLTLKVEVVRKEIEPRRGIAVRIVSATPDAEEKLKSMLAAAEVPSA